MIVEITFIVFGLVVVGSALMVLFSRELVHSAMWLAGMLLGVAGIFLTVGAEFLAVIQVLVYVGAVVTLILFTVMLTVPEERVDFLGDYELPPGIHVESVQDLDRAQPSFTGPGPMIHLRETNPRVPMREPRNLYGVSLSDGEYGSEVTPKKKEAAE